MLRRGAGCAAAESQWRPVGARFCLGFAGVALLAALLLVWSAPTWAQEPSPESRAHTVVSGDTLYSIAEQYGTTVEAIASANDIDDPTLIVVGQKLVIPSLDLGRAAPSVPESRSRVHLVGPGETLPYLSFRYKTTAWQMRGVNGLHHTGVLQPGQELRIPEPVLVITGTPEFPLVVADPATVVRGRTIVFDLRSEGQLLPSGSFLDQELSFVPGEGNYWALAGVDALTPPGSHALTLSVFEVASGDRLTMHKTISITAGNYGQYNIILPDNRKYLLQPAVVKPELNSLDLVYGTVTEELMWEAPFSSPLGGDLQTSAPFGQRRSYNGGLLTNYHTGQDYRADRGTEILAPATGTVVMAERLKVRGNAVILDHGLGVFSGFWHLSRIDVELGQVVKRGEVLGLVGNSGRSTGPHLHWEVRVAGVPVDPQEWLRRELP
ncbi:peptidoglycan DD-metalloendopeptidase family protein [Chloroflexota bacterium]